jgi:cellulose synthase/poly-beta-1,6-N-acetylglucosamine synthase-like glycosyltransferase
MDLIIITIIFGIFVLVYFGGSIYLTAGLKRLSYQTSDRLPAVSIIVSMHNEQTNIEGCLHSLLQQRYPQEKMEIILVNDRSTDKTAELLEKFSRENKNIHTIDIKEIPPDFASKKYALDTAIRKQAKGEIILLTDADGRPGPLWIKSMVSLFCADVGMVLGYAPYTTKAPFNRLIFRLLALEYFSHAAISATTTGLGYPATCVATNIAYRKELFLQLDGFGRYKNYPSGDDDLFMQRVRDETRWKICYATGTDTHVYNTPPASWNKFYHQRLRYASKGFFYSTAITALLIAYFLFNLLYLLMPLLSLQNKYYLFPLLISLLLKLLAETIFFYQTANIIHDKRNLSILPLFSLLHIPYVVYFSLAAQVQRFEWGGIKKEK